MLEIKNVHKTFNKGTINEKKALNGVNLHLDPGDFVTIIGGNGAGKSTTLNMVAGVYPIDQGTIILDGKDISDLAKDAVKLINKFLVDLMDIALNCQNYISTKHLIKGLSLSKVNAVILKYAIALLILKFVQKGFSIYILQSDGDPDHDPIHILTGFCQAVAISVTFLGLYTPLVNIFETFTKAILTAIGSKGEIEAIKDQFLLTLFGNGITTVLLLIIFLIIIFLIYIQIIKNGAELMVLKFAIPLLSVGLMDSDGGSFKIAGKKFLQMGFTCTLQIILLRLAMALLLTGHVIWSVAFGSLALKGPKLIQDYLFANQGSGLAGKLQVASNIRRIFAH